MQPFKTVNEVDGSATPSTSESPRLASSETEYTSSSETSPPSPQIEACSSTAINKTFRGLYDGNIVAKVWRTACESLVANGNSDNSATGTHLSEVLETPSSFPEYVPQEGPQTGHYVLREAEFWTCGFFPGTLFELLERAIRYPQAIVPSLPEPVDRARQQLLTLCHIWSKPLHAMASRTDTHDIGFIIMPALRLDWELNGNQRSLDSIVRAAHSLASRYIPSARAIRSWDKVMKKENLFTDMTSNVIVIIDSMCNLDLIFYAAAHTGDQGLAELAETHARTLLRSHLHPEAVVARPKGSYRGQWYSTCHVANIDPTTGEIKSQFTHQGYANESTWARGQAWAVLGYAQTYSWTKKRVFLEAACGLAEYFMYRLQTHRVMQSHDSSTGAYTTPPWDFDAPWDEESGVDVRDSSAATIAANGMLILSQALSADGQDNLSTRFRNAALDLVKGTMNFSLAKEKAQFNPAISLNGFIGVRDEVENCRFDGLLKHGTANNNLTARKRYCNHGLVYGDYYLVKFSNELLRLGLI